MKTGLKNVLNKVLTEKKDESSSNKGDKSTIEEIPFSKRVEMANRRKAIIKDGKTLSKKEFIKKYGNYTEKEFKDLNIPFKNYDVNSLYDDAKDNWSEDKENKDIEKFTGLVKKQEEEEKALDIKSQNIAAGYKSYMTESQKAKQLKEEIQKKYPNAIDKPFQPVDYQQEYEKGMISDAEKQMKSNIGIPLPSDPTKGNTGEEQMTCITGVCTLANQQGVSFDAMKNTGGVQYDATKKAYIPVSNASFRTNLDKTGYEEVPVEQRRPSDLIQYVHPEHQHMEVLLNNDKNNNMRLFNNYALSNYGVGGYLAKDKEKGDIGVGDSFRQLKKNDKGQWEAWSKNDQGETTVFPEVHVYRPKKETYESAYMKKNPDYAKQLKMQQEFENSDEAKAYQALNTQLGNSKAFDELGEDATLFKNADADVSKYKSAEEMKSALLGKAKNAKLVTKVIDQLYSNK